MARRLSGLALLLALGCGQPSTGEWPDIEQRTEELIDRFGADKVLIVRVDNVPPAEHLKVSNRIKELAGVQNTAMSGRNTRLAMALAPVEDPQALAGKIDFGETAFFAGEPPMLLVTADPARLSR